jgi:hypothetical protein
MAVVIHIVNLEIISALSDDWSATYCNVTCGNQINAYRYFERMLSVRTIRLETSKIDYTS